MIQTSIINHYQFLPCSLSGLLQGEKIHGFQNLFNRLPEYCRNLESDIANVSADGATAVALLESVRRQSGDLLAAVMKHPLILRLMRQYRDQCTPEYLLRLIEKYFIIPQRFKILH